MTAVLTTPTRRPALSVTQLQRALAAVRSDPPAAIAAAINGREPLAIVVGAHPGTGASTVALAIADAAAASGTTVLLAEDTTWPGLSAATEADLGECDTGWHVGRRGRVLIASRAATADPVRPPDAAPLRVVLDVGTRVEAVLPDCPLVLVCRATVPSLRLAERTLDALPGIPLVAVIGPRRWPRLVRGSAGPRVGELLDGGRVARIPLDSRLTVVGLTPAPLPKAVLAAALSLIHLLETDAGGES
jgi:hypothetical protein